MALPTNTTHTHACTYTHQQTNRRELKEGQGRREAEAGERARLEGGVVYGLSWKFVGGGGRTVFSIHCRWAFRS